MLGYKGHANIKPARGVVETNSGGDCDTCGKIKNASF